jgi:hypothetical protein
VTRGGAVLALLIAGCSGGAPTPPEPGSPPWVAEVRTGETSAARAAFFAGWMSAEPMPLTEAFTGDELVVRRGARIEATGPGTHMVWSGPSTAVSESAFLAGLVDWRGDWATLEGRDVHTWEAAATEAGLETLEHARFFGTTPGGARREDRLHLNIVWVQVGEDWRASRVSVREAWTQTGSTGVFVDVTDQVLPPGYDQSGAQMYTDAGPALADADGDGDIDLFVPRMHGRASLYRNDGGYFEDVTESTGLALTVLADGTNAALFLDQDGDGDLDLLVGDRDAGLHLFLYDGGRYRAHAASPFGGPAPWESLTAADFDGDGALDVFACAYGQIDADNQPDSYVDARDGAPNLLLRGIGEAGFEDATVAAGMTQYARRWSYSAAWADYDRDGDQDLYVANDYGPNHLLQNTGGRFRDVAVEAGAEDKGNGMSVTWFDADGDGVLDLYVSNMQSFAGNRLTRSADFPGTPAQVALYRRFAQGNTLLRGRPDGTFEDITEPSGAKPAYWAWGAVPFDHDSDGDQDLLCVTGMYTGPASGDT